MIRMMQKSSNEISRDEHRNPPKPVEPEVVTRHNDAEQRGGRIQKERDSHPSFFCQRPKCEDAPCGPTNVQRGHRRVLVRKRRGRAFVESPRPTKFGNGVRETKIGSAVVISELMWDASAAKAARA